MRQRQRIEFWPHPVPHQPSSRSAAALTNHVDDDIGS